MSSEANEYWNNLKGEVKSTQYHNLGKDVNINFKYLVDTAKGEAKKMLIGTGAPQIEVEIEFPINIKVKQDGTFLSETNFILRSENKKE